jgi:Flp pilus assembly CpaE family ATPase
MVSCATDGAEAATVAATATAIASAVDFATCLVDMECFSRFVFENLDVHGIRKTDIARSLNAFSVGHQRNFVNEKTLL